MEQQPNNYQPWQGVYPPPPMPPQPPRRPLPIYPTGKKELTFGAVLLICSIFLWNSILLGGFNLGFAIGTICVIGCSVAYLLAAGHRLNWYSGSLIVLSIAIAAGFARSGDGFVKYIMLHFLLLAMNLGLCLLAGQNRRSPSGVTSLLDAPRALFTLGFGGMGAASRGLGQARKRAGTAGKKGGAILVGLLIAIPIMVIMVALLTDADAAFEGMLDKLPDTNWIEIFVSAIFGSGFAWLLYCRGTALHHHSRQVANQQSTFKGFNALTINTILAGVCLVYVAYLISQLAYLSGGFAGILPEEFTMAEYARRGFFEMAWLCAINLTVICCSVGLVRKDKAAPLPTRLLCLFIGAVTVFLVATASAKMFMYIGGYGLTRLRVLTEVIMIFMGLTTVLVCVWLFVHKLPYMKLILVLALVMGAGVFWADVDTQVAKYNVEAYQSGKLENIDIDHLSTLGPGAVPYLYELAEDPNSEIAGTAKTYLDRMDCFGYYTVYDFRDWNHSKAVAAELLEKRLAARTAETSALLTELLGVDVPLGELDTYPPCYEMEQQGQTYVCFTFSDEQHEAFLDTLSKNHQWQPFTPQLQTLLNQSTSTALTFENDYGGDLMPNIENGYYFFLDHHPDATDPSNISAMLPRDAYDFTLAVYDTDAHILYFFRMDTVHLQPDGI